MPPEVLHNRQNDALNRGRVWRDNRRLALEATIRQRNEEARMPLCIVSSEGSSGSDQDEYPHKFFQWRSFDIYSMFLSSANV